MKQTTFVQSTPARGGRSLRNTNKSILVDIVQREGPVSRVELARRTGLTRSTVSVVVDELIHQGLVREGPPDARPAARSRNGSDPTGRRPVPLHFCPDAGRVLGIDIGGTTIIAAEADLSGSILRSARWEVPAVGSASALLDDIVARIEGHFHGRFDYAAAGSPGVVDTVTGRVTGLAPNLPQWNGLFLRTELERRLQCAVTVENDVNMALIGECASGAGRGRRQVALIAIGTGVGGAIAWDGEVYRGAHGGAGEIGYWIVDRMALDADWMPRGQMESVVGALGLARGADRRDAKAVFEAARAGDAVAEQVVDQAIHALAAAVVNLAALLDPEVILLGGGLMGSSDMILPMVRQMVAQHSPLSVDVLPAALGTDAGVVGACHQAAQAQLSRLVAP